MTDVLSLVEVSIEDRPERRRSARRRIAAATRVALLGNDANATNREIVQAWRALGIDAALVGVDAAASSAQSRAIVFGRLDLQPTIDGVQPA